MSKIWFITGTSRGLGRSWATAALERGDRVAATARDISTLTDLLTRFDEAILPLELDVTDRAAGINAVEQAHRHFGSLDVIVNNAGYGHFGALEELSETEARAQLDTNLFGPLWITQAALPLLRAQGHGLIVQVSSVGGVVAYPGLGIYHASKWALEGLTEALSREVAAFGIKTMIIEPSAFSTDWAGESAFRSEPLPAYQPIRDYQAAYFEGATHPHPNASTDAVLTAIDAELPPARLVLGSSGIQTVLAAYEQRITTWREWEQLSRSID